MLGGMTHKRELELGSLGSHIAAHISGGLHTSLVLVLLVHLLHSSQAATYYRNPDCTPKECDVVTNRCESNSPIQVWADTCPDEINFKHLWTVETADKKNDKCYWTDCDKDDCGGTPNFKEIDYKMCWSVQCPLTCQKELCCPLRNQSECVPMLECSKEPWDCNVASKDCLDNSTCPDYHSTKVADSGTAVFPFYQHLSVPPTDSCDAHRMWGQCLCSDGVSSPGCDPTDSDSWFAQGSTVRNLPAGLFLTCTVAFPEDPPPLPPSSPPIYPPTFPSGSDNDSSLSLAPPSPGTILPDGAQVRTMTGGKIAVIVICSVSGSGILAVLIFFVARRCHPRSRTDAAASTALYQAMPPTGLSDRLDSFHRQSSMMLQPESKQRGLDFSSRWRRLRGSLARMLPSVLFRRGAGVAKKGGGGARELRGLRGSEDVDQGLYMMGGVEDQGAGDDEDEVFTLDDLDHGGDSSTQAQHQRQNSSKDGRASRPRVAGFYSQASSTTASSLSRVELEMGPQHKPSGGNKVPIPGRVRLDSRTQQQESRPVNTRAFVLSEEDEGDDLERFDPPSPQQSGNDHKRFI